MKYLFTLIILISISCKRYQGDTLIPQQKSYLKQVIEKYQNRGYKHENPLLVINGFLYKPTDAEYWKKMKLEPCEIELIHFLNDQGAENIYGNFGKNGIILINLTDCINDNSPKITKG